MLACTAALEHGVVFPENAGISPCLSLGGGHPTACGMNTTTATRTTNITITTLATVSSTAITTIATFIH